MELQNFLKFLEIKSALTGKLDTITLDSRQVKANSVFVALSGNNFDGHNFIEQAKQAGAALILCEKPEYADQQQVFTLKNLRKKLPDIAEFFYGELNLKTIAVTGTNGKTSVVDLLRQLLHLAGKKVFSMGTIGVFFGAQKLHDTTHTSADIFSFYQQLKQAEELGAEYVVFEASSHALDQQRLGNLQVDQAIFTNLTQDHLDYHQNMQNYFAAKAKLFNDHLKGSAIINVDDQYGQQLCQLCQKSAKQFVTYAKIEQADLQQNAKQQIKYQQELAEFKHHLLGEFQDYNLLAVLLTLFEQDFTLQDLLPLLTKLAPISGRLELVAEQHDIRFFVDYAHTPDALENILTSLEPLTMGRLILLFGCGGERDQEKRPLMGKIAKQYADEIIITDDNPRNENAANIRAEILATCPSAQEIAEREMAIKYAVQIAKPGDNVVIAGKGHETYQIIGKVKKDFSDTEMVKKYVANLG